LVKQRTQLINMIRGLSSEFGVDAPRGLHQALALARRLIDGVPMSMPALAVDVVASLSRHLLDCHEKVLDFERNIIRWHRGNDVSRRLASIPGIGPIGASALAASVTDPHQFKSGRQFAAWLGLTPLQNSSGASAKWGISTCASCSSSA
jgi:transposase